MSQFLYPNVGALAVATDMQTFLAGCNVGLYKAPVSLGPGTTKADLTAQECDFSGYAQKTVTAMQAPYLASGGGASISTGYLQWDWTPATPPAVDVQNQVYGFWVEDAGGDLIVVGSFDDAVAMGEVGNSLPLTVTLNYGRAA